MKRLLVLVVCFMLYMNVFASDGTPALDEQSGDDVIISPQDPAISAITEKMDEAKANGDVVLFKQLLSEYKELNPATTVEDGPLVILDESEVQPLWINNDIVVDSAYNYQGFSMDTRDESRVYLAASRQETSGADYTMRIWSSDDGINWNTSYFVTWSGRDLINPSLKIVETSDSDYVFVAFEAYLKSGSYDRDILVFRANIVSGNLTIFYPANNDNIDEMDPSLDADDLAYPFASYLHLAFESEDSVVYIRSVDLGTTWTERTVIGQGYPGYYSYRDPSLAYGHPTATADSMNLGVAWVYDDIGGSQNIRFRKNISKGNSSFWLPTKYFYPPSKCFDDKPCLKMTHGTMNSAAIVYARLDTAGTNDHNLYEYYTYDAGRNWIENLLYTVGSTHDVLPTLAIDDSPNDYHVFFKGQNDDIRYKEAPYNNLSYPGGWSESIGIADAGDISDVTSPASAVRGEDPCVCWKTYLNSKWKLMFDALWLPAGIGEPNDNVTSLLDVYPAVFASQTDISYFLATGQDITLEIFDALGRSVKTLVSGAKPAGNHSATWNGENDNGEPLASGIYLCVLKAGNSKVSKKITLIK